MMLTKNKYIMTSLKNCTINGKYLNNNFRIGIKLQKIGKVWKEL